MEGNVEDIQNRATYLRAPDGRRIVIPNATVYTSAVTVNTAYPRRRCEFLSVLVMKMTSKKPKILF